MILDHIFNDLTHLNRRRARLGLLLEQLGRQQGAGTEHVSVEVPAREEMGFESLFLYFGRIFCFRTLLFWQKHPFWPK